MAKKTIRVTNITNHGVTVNLKKYNGKILPIRPKGFLMLDEDELAYIMNTSRVFQAGVLQVLAKPEDLENINISELDSPNTITDEDMVKLLSKTHKGLTAQLQVMDNVKVLQRALDKAVELEKSVKVIEIIQTRIEELVL